MLLQYKLFGRRKFTSRGVEASAGHEARLLRGCVLPLVGMTMVLTGYGRKTGAPAKPPEQIQYEQGIKLLHDGNIKAAQANLDTALRLNPHFAPAYLTQAEIQSRVGNTAQAIKTLESLQRAVPQTPHVFCHLAQLHAASGHFVEGVTAAKLALQQEPDCPLAKTQFALSLSDAGKLAEAIALLQSAQQQVPQNERVTLVLAQMLARSGKPQAAWLLVDALPTRPTPSVQADYVRGWLLAEYGRDGKRDDKEALPLLDRALAESTDHGPANLEKGHLLLRAGNTRAALACLQKAARVSEPSVALLSALAEAHSRLKDPAGKRQEQSARVFAHLVEELYTVRQRYLADDHKRDTLVKLARLEAEIGNTQDAEDLLTQVLKRDPNDAEALDLLTPHDSTAPPPALPVRPIR